MNEVLKIIAAREFEHYSEMYKLIDFINKNLKGKDIFLGLTEKEGKQTIKIYEEK